VIVRGGGRCRTPVAAAAGARVAVVLVLACAAGCAPAADSVRGTTGDASERDEITLSWSAPAAVVGEPLSAEFRLSDRDHRPVTGGRLRIEAHMLHPGMAPVLVAVDEAGDGLYRARIPFSMAGDWIVMVTGTLPDGRAFTHRVDVANVRPAG
jgi:hypothetical protein